MGATADTRYNFTAQYLVGATLFGRRAEEIESEIPAWPPPDDAWAEHRACVVSAVMQSTAALETEIHSTIVHGPGHHLGSDRTDRDALALLSPMEDVLDRLPALKRYQTVLHLLGRECFDEGVAPFQETKMLVGLRNHLVHYKSRWGRDMTGDRLLKGLAALPVSPPPFVGENMNFFPHLCLSAGYAMWARETAVRFLDAFFDRLEVPSLLDRHRHRLT